MSLKSKISTTKTKKKRPLKARGKKVSTKRKRVSENISNEYLDKQAQKFRDISQFVNYNDPKQEQYGMKLLYREMRALERKK